MDLSQYLSQWLGREVVVYAGPVKYRGTLMEFMEGGFLVLADVAVINAAAREASEFESCILNVSAVSGIAYEERVGRGGGMS